MAVTVGEVQAVLTARDEMSEKLKVAQQSVKELEAAFASFGKMSPASAKSAEDALASARAEVDRLKGAMGEAGTSAQVFTDKIGSANGSLDQMERQATRMIERLAILFALRGTAQFVESLFDAAQKTADLATQLDVSTDKVQELGYASERTGVPIATLTGALDALGRKIANDPSSVSDALDQLGLNTNQFFAADPGERFDQVSRAIGDMGDKTTRTGAEVALFGTDKVDPVITKLAQLEKAAHDAGRVLGEEDVKAMADAKRGIDELIGRLEVLASRYIAAAIAARSLSPGDVAAGAVAGLIPRGKDLTFDDIFGAGKTASDVQQQLQSLLGNVKDLGPGKTNINDRAFLGTNPFDPGVPAQLGALEASQHGLTDSVNEQVRLEHEVEQSLARQRSAFDDILRIHTRIVESVDKENAKRDETILKAQTANGLNEFQARSANMARFGLNPDGTPLGSEKEPGRVLDSTLSQLQGKKQELSRFGIPLDTSQQETKAMNDYTDALLEAAKATDEAFRASLNLKKGQDDVTDAAKKGTAAWSTYGGTLRSVFDIIKDANSWIPTTVENLRMMVDMTNNIGVPKGNNIGVPNSLGAGMLAIPHFDDGGPTGAGGPAILHDQEYVVPRGGALVMRGGEAANTINVNLYGVMATDRQAFHAEVSRAVMAAVGRVRKFGSAS